MKALRLNIPTTLLNLTQAQLIFVSRLFLMGYSEPEFLVKAFLYLSGLKLQSSNQQQLSPLTKGDERSGGGNAKFKHRSIRKSFRFDTDLLSTMAEKCRFLLDAGEIKPIRWINFARARHYRLYNATFDEYLMAENYYFAFLETRNDQHLNNLISVLYRRPWHWYNSGKIQKRATQFEKVDPAVKNSVFMWYVGFRALVPKRCPKLFSGKKPSAEFSIRNYINGMVHQLSGGNITLNKQLLKQPLWSALDELEQRALDATKLEEAYSKKS